MAVTLAHFSDVHLAPVRLSEVFAGFRPKRLIGLMSWHVRRRHCHRSEIANALRTDIKALAPDHVCCTGDIVNIATYGEFRRAADWLAGLGDGEWVSLVPGNHDAYVKTRPEQSIDLWSGYFTAGSFNGQAAGAFPFVRMRRNVAIIGLTSAQPQPLHKAAGTIGPDQLRDLAHQLTELGRRGYYRAVMVHHPALPGLTIAPRSLTDVDELKQILKTCGAELVLHGHNHDHSYRTLETATGTAHVFGAASGSMAPGQGHDVAAWNLYRIERSKGLWQTDVTIRDWNAATQTFQSRPVLTLSSGKTATEPHILADHN